MTVVKFHPKLGENETVLLISKLFNKKIYTKNTNIIQIIKFGHKNYIFCSYNS